MMFIGLGKNRSPYEVVKAASDAARGISVTPINPNVTVTPIHGGMTVTHINGLRDAGDMGPLEVATVLGVVVFGGLVAWALTASASHNRHRRRR